MDQRITFKNHLFNRVVFHYVDAAENPINLIEVIDDVQVGPLCTVVGTTEQRPHLTAPPAPTSSAVTTGVDVINGLGGDDLSTRAPATTRSTAAWATTTSSVVPARTSCTATAGTTGSTAVSRRTAASVAPGADVGLLCEVKIGIP